MRIANNAKPRTRRGAPDPYIITNHIPRRLK